jgi:hypothetical protein
MSTPSRGSIDILGISREDPRNVTRLKRRIVSADIDVGMIRLHLRISLAWKCKESPKQILKINCEKKA